MWHLSNIKKKITIIGPSEVPLFPQEMLFIWGVYNVLTLQLANNIIVGSCALICLYIVLFFLEWWIWVWDVVKTATFHYAAVSEERSVCSGRPGDYLYICFMGLGSVMLPVRWNSVFPHSLLPAPATSHNMPLGGGGYENFLLMMCDTFVISLLIALYSYHNK